MSDVTTGIGQAPVPMHWIDTTPVEPTDMPCEIADLDVRAEVSGLHAAVDETLTIRNPNRRPISVDVTFAMPLGAAVCGYALEVAGMMVDGVAVPRERARVAFEAERRRGADPGLVEAVAGNVHRTRVYPVPANGERRVRLSFVAPLSVTGGSSAELEIPLPADGVRHMSASVAAASADVPHVLVSGLGGEATDVAGCREWRFEGVPSGAGPVRVSLPDLPSPLVTVERDGDGAVWFAASEEVPAAGDADDAPRIDRLVVLWDASGSRADADHAAEAGLLRGWCEGIPATFVEFAEGVRRVVACDGADALAEAAGSVAYDGATDLSALSAALPGIPGACDGAAGGTVCVLVTDGIGTMFGEGLSLPDGCDALAVVTGRAADMEALRQACRGHAVPVARAPRGLSALAREFAPSTSAGRPAPSGTGIEGVLDGCLPGSGRRCAIGRLAAGAAEATVRLGDGGREIRISAGDAREGSVTSRAWAARRVALLSTRADENSGELLSLGRRFGVASPVTSLLVLETVDQWLRYDVEPPRTWETMWRAWHDARPGMMAVSSDEAMAAAHLSRLEAEWASLMAWHAKGWPDPSPAYGPVGMSATGAPEGLGRRARGIFMSVADAVSGAARGVGRQRMARQATLDAMADGAAWDAPGAADGAAADWEVECEAPMADAEPMAGLRLMRGAPVASEGVDAAPAPGPGDGGRGAAVSVRPWEPDAPYLRALDEALAAGGIEAAYGAYLSERAGYASSPSFFLDCSAWLASHGDAGLALRVLTNLAEIGIDDAAALRVLGWRVREAGMLGLAERAFRRVLALRPEDSQSLRDLALVLSEEARLSHAQGLRPEARAQAEEAAALYRRIALTPWARRALSISLFAVEELNVLRLWAESAAWDGDAPDIPPASPGLVGVPDCDLRVTLAWDADDTDIDLHVTEPSGEEAYYAHRLTTMGGRVSEDITDGFGPELYEVRRAQPGEYLIRAHYYASHQQAVFGPATCTLTVYTDWGRPGQAQEVTTTRLDRERSMVDVGAASYAGVASDGQPGAGDGRPPLHGEPHIVVGMTQDEVTALMGEEAGSVVEHDGLACRWGLPGGRDLVVTFVDGRVTRAIEALPWGDVVVIAQ